MAHAHHIVIVSDGTGRTAQRLMDSVLVQFKGDDINLTLDKTFERIRDKKAVDRVLGEVRDDCLVLFSLISRALCDYFSAELAERGIPHLSVLTPMLDTLSEFLGTPPGHQPGILQVVDDHYYRKIDAIGFTVEHDDGRGRHHAEAELTLLGPSRTCKTPVSMYLACNYGIKVANIPLVADDAIVESLLHRLADAKPGRIVGLLMQPEKLARVREARAPLLFSNNTSHEERERYYGVRQVKNELRFSQRLYRQQGWKAVDVTHRAIEEVSREVLSIIGFKSGRSSF